MPHPVPSRANAYVSMDVTPAVTGSGLLSFAVTRTSTSAVGMNAREAASNQPQLVVNSTPVLDTTAPSVSVSAPAPGAVVAGSAVTVSASASDNVGVAGVQFKLDGANLGAEDTSAPYSIVWDTAGVANGAHSLTAVARDFYDNTATAAGVDVTVSNVTVAMSAPSSGSVVSGGAVAVSATASDNVTGVQFQLDGANLGAEDTSAPYSIIWDTTAVPNGSYTLSAIAHDSVGNTGTATQTTVRVTNPSTSVFAPALDTEVNADLPDTNFGKANALGVDGTPVRIGYLLFNVSIPPGEVVTKATLKLFTPSTSSADTFVHQVSNTEWSETATTYANAPPIGAQVAASGPYQGGSYVSWDVTQAVAGEGLVSFALRRSSPDGNPFNSREAASNQPQLIVESFPTDPSPPPPPPPDLPPTVSADGLPTWQINGVVWSQVVVNNIVYATGSFTKARPPGVAPGGPGEVDAQNIFAYDITTGQRVASFNHSLNAQGLVIAASPDESRVYVGGDFTAVDGIARGHVAPSGRQAALLT